MEQPTGPWPDALQRWVSREPWSVADYRASRQMLLMCAAEIRRLEQKVERLENPNGYMEYVDWEEWARWAIECIRKAWEADHNVDIGQVCNEVKRLPVMG